MSAAIQETIATCTSDDPNALNDVTNNELVLKVAGDSKVNTTISSSSDDDDESSITPATPKVSQEGSESVTEDDNINDNEKTTKHDDADSGASLLVNADNKRDSDQNIHSSSAENEQKTPVDWCRKCCITETCQWRQGPLGGRTLCNACYWQWKLKKLPDEQFSRAAFSQADCDVALKNMKMRKRKRSTRQDETVSKKKRKAPTRQKKENQPKETLDIDTGISSADSLPDRKEHSKKKRKAPTQQERKEEQPQQIPDVDTCFSPVDSLRDRKEYLRAGMYSTFFKQPVGTSSRRQGRTTAKEFLEKRGPSAFKLSLPIHQGMFLLGKEKEFRVPINIMLRVCSGFPLEQPRYTKIRSNLFVERKPNKSSAQVCQCRPPADGSPGCTDNCLNRMLLYECDPEACPCGEQCSNQRFKRKEFVKELEVFPTRGRGWGLRTLVDVKKGTLITEYIGEIISRQTCMQRMQTVYKGQHNFYFFDYHQGEMIDAGCKGNEARFINHSCDPNCHIEKWTSGGEYCFGIFASKDIPAGSELFYDYKFSLFKDEEILQICRCGSANCRGTLGKKPTVREIKPGLAASEQVANTATASAP